MDKIRKNVTVLNDALSVSLPKWPALVVQGKRVTEEQAAEICIRTDDSIPDFRYASNSDHLNIKLSNIFNVPTDPSTEGLKQHWAQLDKLREELKLIPCNYLLNHQIVSSYVGGPHGWCHWSGDIFCNNFNIGKWPSPEEVTYEWAIIAEAFPYLELISQLHDGEACEEGCVPNVEFRIKDGHVIVDVPSATLAPVVHDNSAMFFVLMRQPELRESGITIEELTEKLNILYEPIPQYEKG